MSSTYILNSGGATVNPFAGGVAGVAAKTNVYRVSFTGTWAAGDTFKFNIVSSAQVFVMGSGRVTAAVPTYALTLANRVYFVAGTTLYFSDNLDATAWEQQAAGAGTINMSKNFAMPDNLLSLAAYQGKLAVFGRRNIQIWNIDANPLNFSMQQVLANIGTFAGLTPQSVGDLDVIFGSDTGLRSLRVRDYSLNAYVGDIGSAIDLLVQNATQGLAPATLSAACSIVEPTANRYWLYLNGTIYVLSYFTNGQIVAWNIYTPTYYVTGVQKTFTPQKFLVYQGSTYMRVSTTADSYDHIFVFGGIGGSTTSVYDATVCTVELPWLDFDTPDERKKALGLDYAMTGAWEFSASMDWAGVTNGGGALQVIETDSNPSFQVGQQPWTDDGYHFKLRAVTTDSSAAVLSSLIVTYQKASQK